LKVLIAKYVIHKIKIKQIEKHKLMKTTESKNYDVAHRLLHWSIALCITLLLVTALLHITWFGKNHLAKIIQDNIQFCGGQISYGDATIIAKRIAQPMWDWHFYAGYALIGLYILRLIHLSINGILFPSPFNKKNTLKQKTQGVTYILFYFLVGVTIVTGALMLWGPTNWRWTSQIIHYQSHYYALFFIFMHFGGIIVTELFMEKGVASKMIHG
jgi:cytochrome b561